MISRLLPFGLNRGQFGEIIAKSSSAFAVKLLSAVAAFGFAVAMARLVGAEHTGVYFLTLSLINIAAIVGHVGQDRTALRFTASALGSSNWAGVKGVIRNSLAIVVIVSTAVAATLWLVAPFLAHSVFKSSELTGSLRIMCLGIPAFSILFVGAEILKALRATARGVVIQSLLGPLFSLLLVGILVPYYGNLGPQISFVTASFFTAMVMFLFLRAATNNGFNGVSAQFPIGRLIKVGLPILWMTLLSNLATASNVFIIGAWYEETEVAVFGAAMRIALLLNFFLFSVASIAAPIFANLFEKREISNIFALAKKSILLLSVLGGPVAIAMLLFPELLLGAFGDEFTRGKTTLRLLVIGQISNMVFGLFGYLLTVTGHEKITSVIVFVASAISVGGALAMVPAYGFVGAAITFAVTETAKNLSLFGFAVWRLRSQAT